MRKGVNVKMCKNLKIKNCSYYKQCIINCIII